MRLYKWLEWLLGDKLTPVECIYFKKGECTYDKLYFIKVNKTMCDNCRYRINEK
jgi:hypothetical protein